MAKIRTFYYLVDSLDRSIAADIRSALDTISGIESINMRLNENIIEVHSLRDVEEQLTMACIVAGTTLRTKVKKKDISH
ncbi:unnamed protein product [marine sediment metagenome]|uniref:HMA domain-containing protein n=1 Tax=marine sediment metagenome TaxID=412755 RepID=X1AN40_9ZZZZ